MDWIHCNSCFDQPNENHTIKLSLTSCGHIFCESCGCFANGTSDCCKHCMSKCSATSIGEKSLQTNPQVLEYFLEPEEVCDKYLKVMKFQKAHRDILAKHHKHILSKYNRAKLYIKKLESELKVAKNALRNTPQTSYCSSSEIKSTSTPLFHRNSTPFKIIDAESKINPSAPGVKPKIPEMRHGKLSFRNELSMLSTGSTAASGVNTTGSSVYASPLQDNDDEKYIPKMDNLKLNSFGNRYFKRK